jgi:hypothetical protein
MLAGGEAKGLGQSIRDGEGDRDGITRLALDLPYNKAVESAQCGLK